VRPPLQLFLSLLLIPLCAAAQTTLPNGRLVTPAGVTTPLAPFPFALAVRPDGAQIVSPSIGWPFALNIVDDPGSAAPRVHRIPAGTKNDPAVEVHTGVAYSPDGALLYDATGDSGAVDIYSVRDFSHIARISLDCPVAETNYASSFAASLALSADGRLLYVLDQANWRVAVVDTAARSVIAAAPTGVDPIAIALAPDGRHLYVANSGLFEYRIVGGVDKDNPSKQVCIFRPLLIPPPKRATEPSRRATSSPRSAMKTMSEAVRSLPTISPNRALRASSRSFALVRAFPAASSAEPHPAASPPPTRTSTSPSRTTTPSP
jgi:YVTN family beta-propeller protein